MAYIYLKQYVWNIQVVDDTAECAVNNVQEYAHMNRGPGDLDNDTLVATDHCGCVAQPSKDTLNAIYTNDALNECADVWQTAALFCIVRFAWTLESQRTLNYFVNQSNGPFWGKYPSKTPGSFNIHFSHDIHV